MRSRDHLSYSLGYYIFSRKKKQAETTSTCFLNSQITSSKQNSSGVAAKANVNTSASAKTSSNYKPGSMMAKANMVKEYNERNNSK